MEAASDCRKSHVQIFSGHDFFLHTANLIFEKRKKLHNILFKPSTNSHFFPFHFHIAIFFRFIAANLSLTHFLTWDKPLYCVYLIPYFSFASANTRSIFSFRNLYNSQQLKVCLASSAISTYLLQICLNTTFSHLLLAVHLFLFGQLQHFSLLLLYSLYPSRFVVL